MSAIIIIGAGAAGLMAASAAAGRGEKAVLLEKMDRPGIKFGLTGNGRGNLTNRCEAGAFVEAFGKNGVFLRQALQAFSSQDMVDFIQSLGIETVEEENQKVFVKSGRVHEAVKALSDHCVKSGATLRLLSPVVKLLVENGGVVGVELQDRSKIKADAVILATGGASYPTTGSTGDGFLLASTAGHKIIPPRPALVPLETGDKDIPALQGVAVPDVEATLLSGDKPVMKKRGSLLFTHYGLSGPVVLSLSGSLPEKQPGIILNLAPEKEMRKELQAGFERHGRMPVTYILKKSFPERLCALLLKRAGVPMESPIHQINGKSRDALAAQIQGLKCTITGTRPIEEAMVTRGGVDLKEVDPRTMQSRLVKGLYFAGEVLDLDGDTGGFNLQAAFSTGYLAGLSASGK